MWTKGNQTTRASGEGAGGGGKRHWRNEQRGSEESVEQMKGTCTGHGTAGGRGGEGPAPMKWAAAMQAGGAEGQFSVTS